MENGGESKRLVLVEMNSFNKQNNLPLPSSPNLLCFSFEFSDVISVVYLNFLAEGSEEYLNATLVNYRRGMGVNLNMKAF